MKRTNRLIHKEAVFKSMEMDRLECMVMSLKYKQCALIHYTHLHHL